ncbi:hypothetical protein TSMEX_000873 [Taenia solium]|eukprot:TsM_001198200 transcript=TsM_001198200 gene=TsM_001198200
MGTLLRLGSSNFHTTSSSNHVDGAWWVGGGDGVQSQQAAAHGSSAQVSLEERHEVEYNTPLPHSSSRDIVSPASMSVGSEALQQPPRPSVE